ncbi:MAG: hypothetical protein MUF00_15540, partial [Gemmatimonadaceae bacterium]|nr:hypothetical protein [Gemmatimonadaceae bacterium]
MVDSSQLYRIFAEQLAALRRSPYVDVCCVVRNGAASGTVAAGRGGLRWLRAPMRKRLAYALYTRWDRRHVRAMHDPLALVDASALLEKLSEVVVEPERHGFRQRFPAPAIDTLRRLDLDVLVRFGFGILDGEVLEVARHGIWSFHHGDNRRVRGTPPGLWELIESHPHTGAVLQRLTSELDGGHVLARGTYPTEAGLSAARNRLAPYWGTSELLLLRLWQLHAVAPSVLPQLPAEPYAGRRKIYRVPGNGDVVRWLSRAVASGIRRRVT